MITGGCGVCASALVDLKCETIFVDRLERADHIAADKFLQFDLRDLDALRAAAYDCDAIVHLATRTIVDEDSQNVLKENIEINTNVLKVAYDCGVERVIFASTNHVVGMVELENAPHIYELDSDIIVDKDTPTRPDSFYGVSKVFGESLGRYYAESGGPKFYALRIGAIVGAHEDHPFAYAERFSRINNFDRNSEKYELYVKRLKALWQSRRDFLQIVDLCLKHEGARFDVFYSTSDNPRGWLDISYAKKVLGYKPLDNAELFTEFPGRTVTEI